MNDIGLSETLDVYEKEVGNNMVEGKGVNTTLLVVKVCNLEVLCIGLVELENG